MFKWIKEHKILSIMILICIFISFFTALGLVGLGILIFFGVTKKKEETIVPIIKEETIVPSIVPTLTEEVLEIEEKKPDPNIEYDKEEEVIEPVIEPEEEPEVKLFDFNEETETQIIEELEEIESEEEEKYEEENKETINLILNEVFAEIKNLSFAEIKKYRYDDMKIRYIVRKLKKYKRLIKDENKYKYKSIKSIYKNYKVKEERKRRNKEFNENFRNKMEEYKKQYNDTNHEPWKNFDITDISNVSKNNLTKYSNNLINHYIKYIEKYDDFYVYQYIFSLYKTAEDSYYPKTDVPIRSRLDIINEEIKKDRFKTFIIILALYDVIYYKASIMRLRPNQKEYITLIDDQVENILFKNIIKDPHKLDAFQRYIVLDMKNIKYIIKDPYNPDASKRYIVLDMKGEEKWKILEKIYDRIYP